MLFCRRSQIVENAARLCGCQSSAWVNAQDAMNVLGKIHDYRNIAALAGQAGAGTPRQNRRPKTTRGSYGLDNVINVPGHDHADGHLPIVRTVRGIKGSAACVEADFALDSALELGG
jgi:hypothetical protein